MENLIVFLSLPPTSPLRIKIDVQRTINALKENVDLVITMSEAKEIRGLIW